MRATKRSAGGARAVVAGLCVMALFLVIGGQVAGAQTEADPSPDPIEDYENYPLGLGLVPESCTTEGAEALVGEMYSVDGGEPTEDMRQLNLLGGERLTMTWESFAPGCEEIGVSLSGKISSATQFDPSVNQFGHYSAYCGPGEGMTPCAAPFELSVSLAPSQEVACFQLDAHLGPQLDVVGPDGAFYGFGQEFNMLVSAWNGGIEPCNWEPCAENPDLPAASLECAELSAAQVEDTTTTTTPPTTVAPTPTTAAGTGEQVQSPSPAPSVPTQVGGNQVTNSGALAATGAESDTTAQIGLGLLALGGLAVFGARRLRHQG
ncbi:MAG: hypothetical protein S0880_09420 [Actinomycetota bacterium]|nr:hypothetical protein [Actinomycetota bacterium]